MLNISEKEQMQCYFCGGQCIEGQYCYGCKKYICDECETVEDPPWGKHLPEDHQEQEEEEL